MPRLTIHRGPQTYAVAFSDAQKLSTLLERAGQALAHPCGGRGVCGKCAVLLEGDVSAPSDAEIRCGTRLSCQAMIHGDAAVILPDALPTEQIEAGYGAALAPVRPMPGRFGAAVDIGTTTLALRLYHLQTGACLAVSTMLNPQTTVAADVIGRMDAAMKGQLSALQSSIGNAVFTLLRTACAQAGVLPEDAASLVMTGNTTMLYLLTGRNPVRLSRAPFEANCTFGDEYPLLGRRCYLPHCLHAFVGADTACALLASGMLERQETALLCDIGTNGEIALWHRGQLYIASTAAGPAFEGAGISCGCGCIPGAIDRVRVENGELCIRTMGDRKPVGLCGSGLVDAVAALLELEIVDETGAMEESPYPLAEGVLLTQRDVRALQLAKAAMAAGMDSLLHAAACPENSVTAVYLAGGFGSHLHIASAARIGLIAPALADRVRVIGNAALDGAAMLLMDTSLRNRTAELRRQAQHVRLDGNAYFSQRYVDAMMFDA
ncbi:MAG: ASKHA domain-containing protein [Aristaeellaceae bacterium]